MFVFCSLKRSLTAPSFLSWPSLLFFLSSMQQALYEMAKGNLGIEAREMLRNHRELDVNWRNEFTYTTLHTACRCGSVDVVKVLLQHPLIEVNLQAKNGITPFAFACMKGHLSVLKQLLNDPRVDTGMANTQGQTPLWNIMRFSCFEALQWFIASGRDLGDLNKKGTFYYGDYTVMEVASWDETGPMTMLLRRFMANPVQTRNELRVELGVLEEQTAALFALVIFLCDGLLQLMPPALTSATSATATVRFFCIAAALPMELQMLLCHRVFGSWKQNILRNDSEAAFKALTGDLTLFAEHNSGQ